MKVRLVVGQDGMHWRLLVPGGSTVEIDGKQAAHLVQRGAEMEVRRTLWVNGYETVKDVQVPKVRA